MDEIKCLIVSDAVKNVSILTFACAGLPGQEQKVDCSCLKAACLCFFSTSCLLRSSFSSRISASNLLPWDAACIWKQTVPGRGLPSTQIPGNSHNPRCKDGSEWTCCKQQWRQFPMPAAEVSIRGCRGEMMLQTVSPRVPLEQPVCYLHCFFSRLGPTEVEALYAGFKNERVNSDWFSAAVNPACTTVARDITPRPCGDSKHLAYVLLT